VAFVAAGCAWSSVAPACAEGDPFRLAASRLELVNPEALGRAIRDLSRQFEHRYPRGQEFLDRLGRCGALPEVRAALERRDERALEQAREIVALQREALLSNPLLDFDELLVIRRRPIGDPRRAQDPDKGIGKYIGLPQQSSWQLHTMAPRAWDNEIAILRMPTPGRAASLRTLHCPAGERLVSEMDLRFDGRRILFSMRDAKNLWQIHEIGADGRGLRQVSRGDQEGVHNLDACYLPNERIAFISTAAFQGVPCNRTVNVGMMYVMDADGGNVRQLTFEQDHNYCPSVTSDGRILYLRWEYTDIPHVWARMLFTMNPDGTGQRELYGSGSYWPNSIFYARAVPGHATKIVGTVTGHHVGRIGETVVFDPAAGQGIAGVVQRVPGYGQAVVPAIEDKLTLASWPKTVHPLPLSEKYFLVSAKPRPDDLWGIYLMDVFDNLLLLMEVEGQALVEPIPLRATRRPPVLVDRVDPTRQDALVYLQDVYAGPGLRGVPRGSVRKLRLFTYHFAYQGIAGINHRVGADGPWEPKRVLGTVNVETDGSALFRVPANTPISVQPLDKHGQALQLMRSWMTAMPGEIVSCVGCHERGPDVPPAKATLATAKAPQEIQPWYGPVRGFSFLREVQPVLDHYCIGCHDGQPCDGKKTPDLRGNQGRVMTLRGGDPRVKTIEAGDVEKAAGSADGVFPPSYIHLRSHVRVGGLESDLRLLAPGEFGADTSELVQMLRKGHYGVKLTDEYWDRLITWIDLNAPCHGTWREVVGLKRNIWDHPRRRELRKLYAGIDEDPETYPLQLPYTGATGVIPRQPFCPSAPRVECPNWPFDQEQAGKLQRQAGPAPQPLDLGGGLTLDLVRIPAGQFVMGEADGEADEAPRAALRIERAFLMGKCEITNRQFAAFDTAHDSRFEHKGSWVFSERHLGWPLNGPDQPVVRVSWERAMAFCRWLSDRTGRKVSLPTEAQWEYACRAGSDGPLSYGGLNSDFSRLANLADLTIRQLAYDTDGRYTADIVPRDTRFDDGCLVTAPVGRYAPNAWGLHDMHGNVWEWTRSQYRPYPYRSDDGRESASSEAARTVRGGSWRDMPKNARSACRQSYLPWRQVYNVGFRVVVED